MISINNITKSFNNNVVFDDTSMVFKNNINFLFGDNGVGKSTLINIIAAAIKPDKGAVFLDDKKINFNDGQYKHRVGFLLSFPTYPKHYKVKEYIELFNYIYAINIKVNKAYEDHLINFFNLRSYLDAQISELSIGLIKRVELLVSMLHNPKFYFYDEPFSGIDNNFLPLLNNKILDLAKDGNFFLIATHQIDNNVFKTSNSERFEIFNGKILSLS